LVTWEDYIYMNFYIFSANSHAGGVKCVYKELYEKMMVPVAVTLILQDLFRPTRDNVSTLMHSKQEKGST